MLGDTKLREKSSVFRRCLKISSEGAERAVDKSCTDTCATFFLFHSTKRRSTADWLARPGRPHTGFAADFTAVTLDTGRTLTTSCHVVTSAAILTTAHSRARRAVITLATSQKIIAQAPASK